MLIFMFRKTKHIHLYMSVNKFVNCLQKENVLENNQH